MLPLPVVEPSASPPRELLILASASRAARDLAGLPITPQGGHTLLAWQDEDLAGRALAERTFEQLISRGWTALTAGPVGVAAAGGVRVKAFPTTADQVFLFPQLVGG